MEDFNVNSNNSDSATSSDSFQSNLESFETNSYDSDEFEPVATEQETSEYQQRVDDENEELQMLQDRFNGTSELRSWCRCSHCHLDLITKPEECFCCADIDRCQEKLHDYDEPCITRHPGFRSVCLDEWVLEVAAIGLKTRKNKRYNLLFERGLTNKAQFLRSVSYRQFSRLVHEYLGASKRLPLPCCAYNAIRDTFPSESGDYKGFEDVEDEEEDSSLETTDDESDTASLNTELSTT